MSHHPAVRHATVEETLIWLGGDPDMFERAAPLKAVVSYIVAVLTANEEETPPCAGRDGSAMPRTEASPCRRTTQSANHRRCNMMSIPGHRTTLHIIDGEAYRRIMSGMAPDTLDQFSRQLLDWLHESHPGAAPVTQHDVENQIRETWHRRHDLIRGG
jgi:hypothetical protein